MLFYRNADEIYHLQTYLYLSIHLLQAQTIGHESKMKTMENR